MTYSNQAKSQLTLNEDSHSPSSLIKGALLNITNISKNSKTENFARTFLKKVFKENMIEGSALAQSLDNATLAFLKSTQLIASITHNSQLKGASHLFAQSLCEGNSYCHIESNIVSRHLTDTKLSKTLQDHCDLIALLSKFYLEEPTPIYRKRLHQIIEPFEQALSLRAKVDRSASYHVGNTAFVIAAYAEAAKSLQDTTLAKKAELHYQHFSTHHDKSTSEYCFDTYARVIQSEIALHTATGNMAYLQNAKNHLNAASALYPTYLTDAPLHRIPTLHYSSSIIMMNNLLMLYALYAELSYLNQWNILNDAITTFEEQLDLSNQAKLLENRLLREHIYIVSLDFAQRNEPLQFKPNFIIKHNFNGQKIECCTPLVSFPLFNTLNDLQHYLALLDSTEDIK